MSQPRCNACGQLLIWAETSNGGKLPLNAKPDPLGNLVLDSQGRVGSWDGGRPDLRTRYTGHECKEK